MSLKKTQLSVAVAMMTTAVSAVASESDFVLEEVIVTAQKRAESLQDVPISVSAVGGEKLADAGIENLQDLSAYVPNLKVVEGGLVPQLYIRGIGSSSNQGFEQSVGTYSDGMYMGRSLQSRSSFMDLERVEVLRGPQSILFGQSSIAGAISLVSAKPTDEFDAMISGKYVPEFSSKEVNAYVSGPLTDTLAARLAVRDRQDDGYVKNVVSGKDGPDEDDRAARLTLTWEPTNNLSTSLKFETSELERRGQPGQILDYGIYPLLVPGLNDPAVADDNAYSNELDHKLTFESDSVLLKVEYALGDHTLSLVSGYTEYEYREDDFDGEGSEVDLLTFDMGEDFKQFSQEIRLTSPGGETFDYIAGVFYQTSEQRYEEDMDFHFSNLLGPSYALYDSVSAREFAQDSDTLAAFGQVTWNISEELRVTLGLRYTEDEKEGSRSQEMISLLVPGLPASLLPVPGGGGLSVGDILAASETNQGFATNDHVLAGKLDEKNWTPSFNIQYDFNEDTMLYITYSEGYKAGGFDARGDNDFVAGDTDFAGGAYGPAELGGDNFVFDQEEAETLELGAKMTLLDATAELNVSLYQTDYTNMQVSVFNGVAGWIVLNAGESTVRGFELDGRWRPSADLLLTAGVAYLHYEWTDYQEGPCAGQGNTTPSPSGSGNCDFNGKENIQTPEWTVNLSANHTYSIGDALELRSTLDANFRDNHYSDGALDARSENRGMTMINARLALASTDDTWQIALSGQNLTDQRQVVYANSLPLSQGGMVGGLTRPRSYGIEGLYRF